MKCLKKFLLVFLMVIVSASIIGCNKEDQKALSNDKVSFSYKIENKEDGKLKLEFSLSENSPLVTYKLLENEKEISAGEIAEGNSEAIEVSTIQKKGEKYSYNLIVVDKLGNEVKKELKINLIESDKVEESNANSLTKEPAWNGKQIEYKNGDKVSFDNGVYECIQAHTSQTDWTPKVAASLWKEIK